MEHGLSSSQALTILQKDGPNEIPEVTTPFCVKLLKKILTPITLMLLLAAILSYVSHRAFDAGFILFLLFLNLGITLWQENKADSAIKKLNEHLSQEVSVLRDGKWQKISTRDLVAGDVIKLANGDIIPADAKVETASNLTVNQSALTGESLPQEKNPGDTVYSGAFLATGVATLVVTATGQRTYFGKTILSVEKEHKRSLLEKDIINISKVLSGVALVGVVFLSVVLFWQHIPVLDLLTLDLSLIIAGIPISLPTVMTLIIAFGVVELAKKQVVVRKLSALEDLSNVDLLLTDKTGTLTQNKISVHYITPYLDATQASVLQKAYLIASQDDTNGINQAIVAKFSDQQVTTPSMTVTKYVPADSVSKRSAVFVDNNQNEMYITIGAAQVIVGLCKMDDGLRQKVMSDVEQFAKKGYRSLAVASGKSDHELTIIGLLALSDDIRTDAADVISFLNQNGIDVAMVTGDNKAISQEIARQLAMPGDTVMTKEQLEQIGWDHLDKSIFHKTQAFAEIFPDDKYKLVKAAKQFYVVATNGDGVNDIPAVKGANVGFAVKTAVAALKSTADIVLLTDGISVMKDAIIEARKIFARIYTYSVYRISESLRLIITIVVLGVLYKTYPLTPLQIILIAILNDVPIISLAANRVKIASRPAVINVKERLTMSGLFGLVGIANSLILFFVAKNVMHLDWRTIQTIYFLKLTVSGHMLIYIAHTKERWWKFLPSKTVIIATSVTQAIATVLCLTGFFMPTHISAWLVILVWAWSFFWMQVGEAVKIFQKKD